jgi:hypothetical protein
MTPGQITAGVVIVGAFLAGAWLGRMAANADRDAERAQQSRAQTEFIARNYVSRSVAEAQYAAMAARSSKVLREVIHVHAEPLQCPQGVDVRDIELPGLGDRLRKLRDASGDPAGADVGAVQP